MKALQIRSSEYDTTFRKETAEISSLLANISADKAALRSTEEALMSVADTLDRMAGVALEEEALRAIVSAGSGRYCYET